jgi:hypothetical protein
MREIRLTTIAGVKDLIEWPQPTVAAQAAKNRSSK